jgi:hypothetical protein
MFPEIDQSNLDSIFEELEQKMLPTKFMTQQKIYVPEFIGFLKSGPLFQEEKEE